MSDPRREPRSREDYARGLPDHHDPTAGIGGAPPAQSALTPRLVMAAFRLVVCTGGGILWLGPAPPVAVGGWGFLRGPGAAVRPGRGSAPPGRGRNRPAR